MRRFWIAIRAYFSECDISLFISSLIASLLGLVLIQSATASYGSSKYMIVQIIGIILGILLYLMSTVVDLEQISKLWKVLFIANLLFLTSTLFFGVGMDSTGNNSWIRFNLHGFQIGIQPGEIGKILFIITLSKHIDLLGTSLNRFRGLIAILIHFALTVGVLFISSSDMGMVLSYCFIFVMILLISGLKLRYFAIGGAVGGAGIFAVYKLNLIPVYMLERIKAVLDPTYDLANVGWQGYRSKVAIVGGGWFGQGLGQGIQTQTGSLPAKHTDFIFSVACEELGLIGAILILFALFFIVMKCYVSAWKLGGNNYLGRVCTGVGSVFLFQILINVGMCLGILPVIGLTLPFISYGGTSVMTMFFALGLVASARRFGAQPAGLSKFQATTYR